MIYYFKFLRFKDLRFYVFNDLLRIYYFKKQNNSFNNNILNFNKFVFLKYFHILRLKLKLI